MTSLLWAPRTGNRKRKLLAGKGWARPRPQGGHRDLRAWQWGGLSPAPHRGALLLPPGEPAAACSLRCVTTRQEAQVSGACSANRESPERQAQDLPWERRSGWAFVVVSRTMAGSGSWVYFIRRDSSPLPR